MGGMISGGSNEKRKTSMDKVFESMKMEMAELENSMKEMDCSFNDLILMMAPVLEPADPSPKNLVASEEKLKDIPKGSSPVAESFSEVIWSIYKVNQHVGSLMKTIHGIKKRLDV